MSSKTTISLFALAWMASGWMPADKAHGQAVCLPAPRLMTTFPMGARQGATVEVLVTGQNAEEISQLLFSNPGISSAPVTDEGGQPVPGKFRVTVQPACPVGICEARLVTRLGFSTARAFTVGDLSEVTRDKPNTTLESAQPIQLDSICNGYVSRQAIDYYRFQAGQGDRVFIECAARGIDSKLKPVVILGDSEGADLMVERRGGVLDYRVPEDGEYTIKIHDLTYNGGPEYFYRLVLRRAQDGQPVSLHPATRSVSSFSWPPEGYDTRNLIEEIEPGVQPPGTSTAGYQQITLPTQIAGSFFPAADVDTFEFTAEKGETWWVEVASERLGRPTDPAVIVQQVSGEGADEQVADLVELSDILSPVKVSSNGYSYDGPPYNAGSSDIIGSFTVKQSGKHRIQISDLFGGTRNDPRNRYRMIIRKAQPDFALVSWSLHMNLRNGDRNALSKPLALRRGAAMILEVIAVRRDGFDGPIQLTAENLPPGVEATGFEIPQGQTRGFFVLSADGEAPAGYSLITLSGTGTIAGKEVKRQCHWASMRWPVPDAWGEIPAPRIVDNLPVSVTDSEYAPLSLVANEDKVWEVPAGGQLTIPLVHTRRCDFSGATLSLQTLGAPLEKNAPFDASLTSEITEARLDLAKNKVQPGEYAVSFYGSAVARYSYNPEAVPLAEKALELARAKLSGLEAESGRLAAEIAKATGEQKAALEARKPDLDRTLAAGKAEVVAAEKRLNAVKNAATPKDIVDIVVSKPIRIRVLPVEKKAKP